jgi:potassium/hydrogen antiporter
MTNYIILGLCLIVIISYLFDISSKYSKIPGVILLIAFGMGIQMLVTATGLRVPNFKPVLPVIGTLGLILIVLEASLDLKLEKNKTRIILKSFSSAILLFGIFVSIFTYVLVKIIGYSLTDSLLNTIPLGIISSAVAISAANHFSPEKKEFIIYESSVSDIVGIMAFDFILLNQNSYGQGFVWFVLSGILTVIFAIITTSVLGYLLHKIRFHVNYLIIMTSVVLVYVLAKMIHLPALFFVLAFGMALSNSRLAENTIIKKVVDFEKFRNDLESFKRIVVELTFLVRSFFFIIFGFYTSMNGLFNHDNLLIAAVITTGIFFIRWVFFTQVLKSSGITLILFAPRGLITILLFLSIPPVSEINLINTEVITLVILMTLIVMMFGNFMADRDPATLNTSPDI